MACCNVLLSSFLWFDIYIYICMAFFLGRCSGCVLSVF